MSSNIFMTYLLIGATYSSSVWYVLREHPESRIRWLKNNPGFTFYILLIFPMATAVFFDNSDFSLILNASQDQNEIWPIIIMVLVLLPLGIFVSVEDLKRSVIEPYKLKEYEEALKFEKSNREKLAEIRHRYRKFENEEEKDKTLAEFRSTNIEVVKEYIDRFPCLGDVSGLRQRGNLVAWSTFLINFVVGITLALQLLYVSGSAFLRVELNQIDGLMFSIGLTMLWFPIRIYTEWYLHFYSMRWLNKYYAFFILIFCTFIGYAFLFANSKIIGIQAFSAFGTVLLAVIGVTGKIKPGWLLYTADQIEAMPLQWYIAFLALIGFFIVTISFALLPLVEN